MEKKTEERIKWLRAINKNRVKRRTFQFDWDLVDSEGYRLDLKPCVEANLYYCSPSIITLDFPLSKYNKNLELEEDSNLESFKLSRLEASLILGKDSKIYAKMRGCEPRFDEYNSVKNWELQAMIFAAITNDYNRADYYSFGRFVDEPTDKNPDKLIIPVQYYSGGRVLDEEGHYKRPIMDLGDWSERKLIKQVRAELSKNQNLRPTINFKRV